MAENIKGNGRSFHTYKSDNRDKIAMKKKTINGLFERKTIVEAEQEKRALFFEKVKSFKKFLL